jgi:hypothetical protein
MTGYQTGNSGSHRRENIDISPIRRQLSRGRAFVAPFCMDVRKLVGEIIAAEAICAIRHPPFGGIGDAPGSSFRDDGYELLSASRFWR